MSKFSIEECNNLAIWNKFVEESPQGTIYSNSIFITSIYPNSKFFLVKNSENLVGGVSLLIGSDNKLIYNPHYIQYYNSILFSDNSHLKNYKKIKQEFQITEMIINKVVCDYDDFYCVNTPYFNDIRPFQWFNYHNKESGVFNNEVSYSPFLNLRNIDFDVLIKNVRYDRRRDFTSKKFNLVIKSSKNIDILSHLHNLTFQRQNIVRNSMEIEAFEKIVKSSLDNDFGELLICEFDGIPIAASLFLFDKKRAYYQFGAQHPDYRNIPGSTRVLLQSFLNSIKRGNYEVDLIGANSPYRSDYKISFNCELKHYYLSILKSKFDGK